SGRSAAHKRATAARIPHPPRFIAPSFNSTACVGEFNVVTVNITTEERYRTMLTMSTPAVYHGGYDDCGPAAGAQAALALPPRRPPPGPRRRGGPHHSDRGGRRAHAARGRAAAGRLADRP